MKILCASDIHLGRIPALPAPPGGAFTHRTAWDFVVATALRERPALVLLAGDVIDSDNQFLETWQPLRDGVARLLEAGIAVTAVAGNHDSEVFPRLHQALGGEPAAPGGAAFRLLGCELDGARIASRWTEEPFTRDGETVWLAGWSFSAPRCASSPLADFRPVRAQRPLLGLLHGDVDVPGSIYGPLRSAELEAAPVDRWVLGHIHAPTGGDGARHFYCGSPVPLRATERGAHGCWLLEARDGAVLGPVLAPAPVRVDRVEVPLEAGEGTPATLAARIHGALLGHLRAVLGGNPRLEVLYAQVRLAGRCDAGAALAAIREDLEAWRRLEEVDVRVLAVEDATDPELPLEAWSVRKDACGRLARMVLALRRGEEDAEARELAGEILREERRSRSLPAYAGIRDVLRDPATGTGDWAREQVLAAALRILGEIRRLEGDHA